MSKHHHGKGRKAYLRKREALKRRVAREGLTCGHGSDYGCGKPIDTTIPYPNRMSFSADHPTALANGGHMVRQELVPMHLGCNSSKGDAATVEIWEAS